MLIDRVPHIRKAVIAIASYNGAINRSEPVSEVLERANQVLSAEGVYAVDMGALDQWLETLTQKQWDDLLDGEQSERDVLVELSPMSQTGERTARIFEDIFDNL